MEDSYPPATQDPAGEMSREVIELWGSDNPVGGGRIRKRQPDHAYSPPVVSQVGKATTGKMVLLRKPFSVSPCGRFITSQRITPL